jgi:phosphatidylglycerophosphatase A
MKSGLGVMLDDIAAAVYAWALIVLLSAAWQRWA